MSIQLHNNTQFQRPNGSHYFREGEEDLPRTQFLIESLGAYTGGKKHASFHGEIGHISHIKLLGIWTDTLVFPAGSSQLLRIDFVSDQKQNLGAIAGFNVTNNNQIELKEGLLVPISSLSGWTLFTDRPLFMHRWKNYDGKIKTFDLEFTTTSGAPVTFTNMTLLFEVFTLIEQ